MTRDASRVTVPQQSSMSGRSAGLRDEDWEPHKATIRKRYLVDQISLKDLVHELADRGLIVKSVQRLSGQLSRVGANWALLGRSNLSTN